MSKNEYLITIILPSYNGESTLKRCINSIINQSIGFENIELFIYDDNSSDDSKRIIKKYSDNYDNINTMFSDENSGYPGTGRNKGIKNALADYVMFIDQDDEYAIDICKKLYNAIKNEDADMASCNYINKDSISEVLSKPCFLNGFEEENKIIINYPDVLYFRQNLIWVNIFKKSILINNDIYFPEKDFAEDFYLMNKFRLYSNKIIYLKNYVGYLRNLNDESNSNNFTIKKMKGIWNIFYKTLKLYPNNVNLSFIYEGEIYWTLYKLYSNNLIFEDEKGCYEILQIMHEFENKINFKSKQKGSLALINKFVKNGKMKTAIILLKVIGKVYHMDLMRRINRKLN